jgi:hypothetical protein
VGQTLAGGSQGADYGERGSAGRRASASHEAECSEELREAEIPVQIPFTVGRRLPKIQAECQVPSKDKSRQSFLLPEQKQPSLVIGTLARYLPGLSSTLGEAAGMHGNQHAVHGP